MRKGSFNASAWVRSAVAVVFMTACITVVRAATWPEPVSYVPRPVAREIGLGAERLAAGDRAAERGELRQADEAYRAAWEDLAVRTRAAAALQSLHRTPGFTLAADEPAVAATRHALGATFRRFDTPHFVILSDCSTEWTAQRGDLLERARAQFFRVTERMGLPAVPHQYRLVCVLFNDHDHYQAFARANDGLEAGWVAGYYATRSNRIVFYNDATSPAYGAARDRLQTFEQQMRDAKSQAEEADRHSQKDLAQRLHASADDLDRQIKRERSRLGEIATAHSTAKTVHEAVHLLAFNCGVQLGDHDYPFWLSEGLATSFETDRPQEAFGPDRLQGAGPRRDRFEELRQTGKLMPVSQIVTLSESPDWDADTADAMYCYSHALFTNLFRKDPAAVGAYLSALSGEPPGRLTPARQLDLFRMTFGDPAEIDKRMARGR
jgi:hypothetical protein